MWGRRFVGPLRSYQSAHAESERVLLRAIPPPPPCQPTGRRLHICPPPSDTVRKRRIQRRGAEETESIAEEHPCSLSVSLTSLCVENGGLHTVCSVVGCKWAQTDRMTSPNDRRPSTTSRYRGRIAPSPTGYLHLGHARTFWIAQQRAQVAGGALSLRMDDLDGPRCRPEFAAAAIEDLKWFGFRWEEGPDIGGPRGPYTQSERMPLYIEAFERLRTGAFIYPCKCSRQDVLRALSAPHEGEEEPLYPGTCRPAQAVASPHLREGINWRFRVPAGGEVSFHDGHFGAQRALAGRDFGDFLVWRKDDFPSYQLACTVDDALMGITEVVRGADLITSTFRQFLLYRALGWTTPAFFHCELMTDETGERLAKRSDALSLRALRAKGRTPESLRAGWWQTET